MPTGESFQEVQGILGEGQAERREKHIEIDDALNQLERQVSKIRDFTGELSEGPVHSDEGPNTKPPVPNFLSVYSNIADRIHQSTKHISESMSLIRDILL